MSLGHRLDYFVSSFRHDLTLHTSRITDRLYEPSIACARNVSGRVYGVSGGLFQSVYTSGWAANRARGVLASTMYDAYSIPDVVAADAQVQTLLDLDDTGMPSFLREASIQPGTRIGHYQQWKVIDEVKGAGKERGCMHWDDVHEFGWVYTGDLKPDTRSKSPVM
ncbi:hypothetical protein BS47DRAFT_1388987 [Hydnum rufescens UP504]|uniref:Uncharacterized protein n=1 Tax=Hydnum rufescens UP504 TaxID=1448309 RepID=A0A9P6E137_9AGAM|nr:hypothetical protein BS47DRAFT_1388987 [Hydnum rufescens UP504]